MPLAVNQKINGTYGGRGQDEYFHVTFEGPAELYDLIVKACQEFMAVEKK